MANTFVCVCCFLFLLCNTLDGVEGSKFILHTRQSKTESLSDDVSISSSNFDAAHLTKFIIHGFQESSEESYVLEMARSLLVEGDYNVILVDWKVEARSHAKVDDLEELLEEYKIAMRNVPNVGNDVANFIKKLMNKGMSLSDLHLIGFSLGAHCAGDAGRILSGRIGRITGLDPAGYLYEDVTLSKRLDHADAVFVDVIHTEITMLGLLKSAGHLDFYVNRGEDQPGCSQDDRIEEYKCNHRKAAEYFILSIDANLKFAAYRSCGSNGCPQMGLHADEYKRSNRREELDLRTVPWSPYAASAVTLTITTADRDDDGDGFNVKGELYIAGWYGSSKTTSYKMCLGNSCKKNVFGITENQKFKNGKTYTYYTLMPNGIGKIEGIELLWDEENFSLWEDDKVYIKRIEILDYPTVGKRLVLCGSVNGISTDTTESFKKQYC